MPNKENARFDAGISMKADEHFTAKSTSDPTAGTTPCSTCAWFDIGRTLLTRGQKWSACNLSATRDPGRKCRWFADERQAA